MNAAELKIIPGLFIYFPLDPPLASLPSLRIIQLMLLLCSVLKKEVFPVHAPKLFPSVSEPPFTSVLVTCMLSILRDSSVRWICTHTHTILILVIRKVVLVIQIHLHNYMKMNLIQFAIKGNLCLMSGTTNK